MPTGRLLTALRALSFIFSAAFVAFGVNYIARPAEALALFGEAEYPTVPSLRPVIDCLLFVAGVRDVFMGFALFITSLYKNTRANGWLMVAGGSIAVADGYATKTFIGQGEMAHYGYAPVFIVPGLVMALL